MEKNRIALFEFRRLWSLVWMAFVLAGALYAVDEILHMLAGPAPAILATQARVNARKRARMLDAIVSAEERMDQERRSDSPQLPRLCIIIGSSSAKVGLDESVLSGPQKHGFKVVNLSGNALGFQELDHFIKMLSRSALKPDLILAAIHPVFMIEARTVPPSRLAAPDPGRRNLINSLEKSLQSRWAIANLPGMYALFHNQFMEARFALLRCFGEPASALESSAEGTGSGTESLLIGLHAGPELLDLQMRHWEQIGAFDPLQYSSLEEGTKALQSLLRRTAAWVPHTAVLLMPERSDFRRRVPVEATARLVAAVASADASCLVLDLKEAVSDQDFFDYQHVNKIGRKELSRKVGEQIGRLNIDGTH